MGLIKSFKTDVRADFSALSRKLKAHKSLLTMLLVLGLIVAGNTVSAEVTLPATVDVTEYITAGVAAMAIIVAAALGGYTAFLLIRKAFRWLNKALG